MASSWLSREGLGDGSRWRMGVVGRVGPLGRSWPAWERLGSLHACFYRNRYIPLISSSHTSREGCSVHSKYQTQKECMCWGVLMVRLGLPADPDAAFTTCQSVGFSHPGQLRSSTPFPTLLVGFPLWGLVLTKTNKQKTQLKFKKNLAQLPLSAPQFPPLGLLTSS